MFSLNIIQGEILPMPDPSASCPSRHFSVRASFVFALPVWTSVVWDG